MRRPDTNQYVIVREDRGNFPGGESPWDAVAARNVAASWTRRNKGKKVHIRECLSGRKLVSYLDGKEV